MVVALVALSGCTGGVGYSEHAFSSAAVRRIESSNGEASSGLSGEMFMQLPLPIPGTDQNLWVMTELKRRFIVGQVHTDAITTGLFCGLPLGGAVGYQEARVYLTAELGGGYHHLNMDGLPHEYAWGGHVPMHEKTEAFCLAVQDFLV